MTGLGQKLASLWLRRRADELRAAASKAARAYTKGTCYEAAQYVADKYRKAADLLDDAATEVERRPRGPGRGRREDRVRQKSRNRLFAAAFAANGVPVRWRRCKDTPGYRAGGKRRWAEVMWDHDAWIWSAGDGNAWAAGHVEAENMGQRESLRRAKRIAEAAMECEGK